MTYLDLYGNEVYFGGRSATTITTMGALGFTPTEFVRTFPEDRRQNPISHELLSKIDADVILAFSIGTTPEGAQKAIPALKDLKAVQENRFQYLPDLSLSAPSVLSIPYGVDNLMPFLQRATAA